MGFSSELSEPALSFAGLSIVGRFEKPFFISHYAFIQVGEVSRIGSKKRHDKPLDPRFVLILS